MPETPNSIAANGETMLTPHALIWRSENRVTRRIKTESPERAISHAGAAPRALGRI